MTNIFISHDTVEAPAAHVLRTHLEAAGHAAFVASTSILLGDAWRQRIEQELARADFVIVLCSKRSVRRPWVWMEFGAAVLNGRNVTPVLLDDLKPDDAPGPFRTHQLIELNHPSRCRDLLAHLGVPIDDAQASRIFDEVKSALSWDHVRPGTPLLLSGRPAFALDVSHRQDEWPEDNSIPSIFNGFRRASSPLRDVRRTKHDRPIEVGEIDLVPIWDTNQLYTGHLSDFHGLVVASPLHTRMSEELMDEIQTWVISGGRLLLMGYQYGDRHHGANLRSLAERFGLQLHTSIIGPPKPTPRGTVGSYEKPYDVRIDFDVASSDHALVGGVSSIAMVNVQSIDVEPGGSVIVSTGPNTILEPLPADVKYNTSGVFVRGSTTVSRGPHDWLGVVVSAPSALCGAGEVVALGTWKFPLDSSGSDNETLFANILRWLTERPAS